MLIVLAAVGLSAPLPGQVGQAWAASCVGLPSCKGCGCQGGTGYRAPDGHCVGFRALSRLCGADPAKVCTFENLPHTGENHDCALGITHPAPLNDNIVSLPAR